MRAKPILLAFLLAASALAPDAFGAGVDPGAATPVQREQAQLRFARGRQYLTWKKYPEALAELDASLEIVASPNTRLLKARCLRDMGKLVAAYVEFGRTIVEAKELARTDTRYAKAGEGATEDRAALEPQIGFVTVTVEHASPDTKLVIAGEEIRRAAWGEAAPVAPGDATISVETKGSTPVTKTVTLAAGEKKSVTIDAGAGTALPTAAPPPAPVAVEEKTHVEPPSDRTSLRPYAYVAGAVGAAGFATFAIFGLMSSSTYSDLQNQCKPTCPASKNGDISSGKSQQTIANVGLVVGVVGAAAGVTLFVVSAPKKNASESEPPKAAAVVGPGWIGVKGAF
jgi:hypothetical protein